MASVNDNDMEIIVNGSQEKEIRKMLKNRLFCLIEMSAQKPERCTSIFSSSVFVGFMNDGFLRTFAIRDSGAKTAYEKCEYYLLIYHDRGKDAERRKYFSDRLKRKKAHSISVKTPAIKELLAFLIGKELVLITNEMLYGNMEAFKVKDFLERLLLIREDSESEFFRRVEDCDIRVYLNRVNEGTLNAECRLVAEDIRNFDIGQRIVEMLHEISKRFFAKQYYCAGFEARSDDTKALYFVTRFHSNTCWKADPVNIVTSRIAAFVLPGTASYPKDKSLPSTKLAHNSLTGEEYVIDSIHFNSDVFYDISEFAEFLDSYLYYFSYD